MRTREPTRADHLPAWLTADWKFSRGGSCKGCAVLLAYAQSCPAVIWGVLQLWRRRITMLCTLSTAFTELSISASRQTFRDPYFSLGNPCPPTAVECTVYTVHWALHLILSPNSETFTGGWKVDFSRRPVFLKVRVYSRANYATIFEVLNTKDNFEWTVKKKFKLDKNNFPL